MSFKKLKLVLVPYSPEKLEVGMFTYNGKRLDTVNSGDVEIFDVKEPFINPVKPYYISEDDKIEEGCLRYSTRYNDIKTAVKDDEEYNKHYLPRIYKVIIGPEQEAWFHSTFSSKVVFGKDKAYPVFNMGIHHLQEILNNDGICYAEEEMQMVPGMPDGEPEGKLCLKKIDNKVLIHLEI